MDYKIFTKEEELPTGKNITVIKACDEEDGAIIVCSFRDGEFTETGYISPSTIETSIEKYLGNDQIYVSEEAKESFEHALAFAKIFKACGGDFVKMAEALDEDIELRGMQLEMDTY